MVFTTQVGPRPCPAKVAASAATAAAKVDTAAAAAAVAVAVAAGTIPGMRKGADKGVTGDAPEKPSTAWLKGGWYQREAGQTGATGRRAQNLQDGISFTGRT